MKCIECDEEATHEDTEGVPLCREHWDTLVEDWQLHFGPQGEENAKWPN